jgi:hypothetical protein
VRQINLTQGLFALVDDEDYARLNAYNWHANWSENTRSFYARRGHYLGKKNGRSQRRWIYMHREVLGLAHEDKRQGDHIISGTTLDNRRKNLRIVTHAQNLANCRKRRDNKSGRSGVWQDPKTGKYQVHLNTNKVRKYLGLFISFADACAAREAAERGAR